MFTSRKKRLAALIETVARFQAGFLSSEDVHRFLLIFISFQRFSQMFIDLNGFHDLHGFPSMGSYSGKCQPAALMKTFARFKAGFLSSEVVHRVLSIFIHKFS